MAMTLWGIVAIRPANVRARIWVSSSVSWGTEWSTLRRWAHAARALVDLPATSITLREVAARVAQIAIGRAPPSLRTAPTVAQACAGATARSWPLGPIVMTHRLDQVDQTLITNVRVLRQRSCVVRVYSGHNADGPEQYDFITTTPDPARPVTIAIP
ncbi:hypothetical protein BH11MYX1_BH11MYX1_38090 [soil metagenome]